MHLQDALRHAGAPVTLPQASLMNSIGLHLHLRRWSELVKASRQQHSVRTYALLRIGWPDTSFAGLLAVSK